ncbi:MAG: hypothetical protein GVY09_20050, partial [Gammaproteobacteria bacterium]|nr:hypothetical protein [Gammaproteobacteria bacterium]
PALDTDAGAPGADTVLLPVNTRPLGPLPERRRRRFRDYFTRSLSVAAARNAGPADETAAPGELAHPFSPVADGATHAMLGEACATCRGHCCAQGGEHAFQRPEILSAYLLRHPHLRPRDVLAAYLDHLPTTSYRGSCVFHTRNGCSLPVAMRSPSCRDYLCDALWGIVRGQRAGGPAQVFGVAVEDATPVRAGVIRRPSAAPRTGPRGG